MTRIKDWEQQVYLYVERIKEAETELEAEDIFEELLDYIVEIGNTSALVTGYGTKEDQ